MADQKEDYTKPGTMHKDIPAQDRDEPVQDDQKDQKEQNKSKK